MSDAAIGSHRTGVGRLIRLGVAQLAHLKVRLDINDGRADCAAGVRLPKMPLVLCIRPGKGAVQHR